MNATQVTEAIGAEIEVDLPEREVHADVNIRDADTTIYEADGRLFVEAPATGAFEVVPSADGVLCQPTALPETAEVVEPAEPKPQPDVESLRETEIRRFD